METISDIFLYIILMVFLGYFLKRLKFLKLEDLKPLNRIVLDIAMPCMIFTTLYGVDDTLFSKLFILPIIPIFIFFLIGLFAFILLKIFNLSKFKVLSLILPITLGNTGYLGYPIVLNLFGNDALLRAVFFDISTPLIFLFMSAVLIINFGGKKKDALKNFLKFPILWAIIIAIVFNVFNIGEGNVLEKVINDIATLTVPLAMIILGVSFNFNKMKENIKVASFISLIKLIFYPLIAFILITIVGLTGLEFKIGLIQSAMPSAILSLVLAINYKLDIDLVSNCIFLSTILSFISLPILSYFLI
jgi:predicted permease